MKEEDPWGRNDFWVVCGSTNMKEVVVFLWAPTCQVYVLLVYKSHSFLFRLLVHTSQGNHIHYLNLCFCSWPLLDTKNTLYLKKKNGVVYSKHIRVSSPLGRQRQKGCLVLDQSRLLFEILSQKY